MAKIRWSIRNRIAFGMLISAILVLPVALLALYYVSQMNNLTTILAESDTELLRIGNTINHLILQVRNAERNFLFSGDTAYLTTARIITGQIIFLSERSRQLDAELTHQFDSLLLNLANYRQLLDSLDIPPPLHAQPRSRVWLAELKKTRNLLLQLAQNATDPIHTESLLNAATRLSQEIEIGELIGSARNLFYDRMNQTLNQIIESSEKITSRANQRISEHKSRVGRLYSWSQRNIITAILIFTGLLVYLISRLPGAIVLPIKRIANALTRAEQGDLNIRVQIETRDEFDTLAKQLNRVFALLRAFDERKTEHILKLQRQFSLLTKNIKEGVIVVDRSARIVHTNPAMEPLFGMKAQEAIGKSIKEFAHLTNLIPHLEQLLSGASSHQECEIIPGLPFSAFCFETIRDQNGLITGAMIIVTNPTAPETESEPPEPL
ncbi:MAG: PAS domain-containing protein [bacterium]